MTGSGVASGKTQLQGVFAQRAYAIGPAVGAMLLGAVIIFSAGFAGPQIIHDAAHDSRHALAFPCH